MIASVELSKDRRLAAVVAIGTAAIAFLVLHFLTYRIPMPPLPEQLKYQDMEAEFIELEAASLPETVNSGGGGGGDGVNAPKSDKFVEQMEEVAQTNNSNYHAPSGKSNHTNTTKPTNNGSSTQNQDDNPFNNDGGSGTGKGGGNGSGLGKHTGGGEGDGDGDGKGPVTRTRISEPNTREIHSDEDCNIKFNIRIDETGRIVGTPAVVRAGTTTTDEVLIKKVAALVARDTRYNAVKGAKIVTKTITVHINAN
jgi:hypothetical protein